VGSVYFRQTLYEIFSRFYTLLLLLNSSKCTFDEACLEEVLYYIRGHPCGSSPSLLRLLSRIKDRSKQICFFLRLLDEEDWLFPFFSGSLKVSLTLWITSSMLENLYSSLHNIYELELDRAPIVVLREIKTIRILKINKADDLVDIAHVHS
jgi:hypothetical protein